MRRRQKSVRFPQAHQIRKLLGLNPGKLPQNIVQRDYTLGGLHFRLLPTSFDSRRPHRLEVECNVCRKWMSCGRFNQHQAIHPFDSLSELSKQYVNHELDDLLYGSR